MVVFGRLLVSILLLSGASLLLGAFCWLFLLFIRGEMSLPLRLFFLLASLATLLFCAFLVSTHQSLF